MRKYILLSLLLSACLSVHSQNDFATITKHVTNDYVFADLNAGKEFTAIKDEVNSWCKKIFNMQSFFIENKNIDFTAQHYLINGIVSKGKLFEGSIAEFYDMSSFTPNLLLQGRVSYQTNRLVVEGIKYDKTPTGTNRIYGLFYVYNMDDYSMNYKPKKAGALRIKCAQALYLESNFNQSPVIVKYSNPNSFIYIYGKAIGKERSFLSAEIPNYDLNNDETFDIVKIILLIGDNATLRDGEGMEFKGRIKPIQQSSESIMFQLMEGELNYGNGDRFEGNLSAKTVGHFFVDGTTFFRDGTIIKGNWLENYKLSDSQWAKVYQCRNPSRAKELITEYEKQKKQERYQLLVDSVKALGETPYQKALISWRDRYYKQLETECGVSGKTILGGFMIEGLGDQITNQTTLGYSMAAITFEAYSKKPMAFKSITEKMALEIRQIEKLALPIEKELEKIQAEIMKSRNSTNPN